MRMRPILLVLALVALTAVSLTAQQTTGTIVGTVTDASGAVIPNATVAVTNVDRNTVVRTLQTNASGEYVATFLPIGRYSIQVTAPGFKTFTHTNIELNVNDRLNISARLETGNVQETLTVEANANQVETQSATSQGPSVATIVIDSGFRTINAPFSV